MRKPLEIPELAIAELEALDTLYRTTRDVRSRTRAQIVLLAGEQRLTAPAIARIVRESDQTVRTWLKGCVRNGTTGAIGARSGRREGGSGGGQAAASSAMIVAQRSWNTRRRSPSDTTWPERATARKYWRCSSKAGQKRAAEVKLPKPRIG